MTWLRPKSTLGLLVRYLVLFVPVVGSVAATTAVAGRSG
jgi:hypothetical protein